MHQGFCALKGGPSETREFANLYKGAFMRTVMPFRAWIRAATVLFFLLLLSPPIEGQNVVCALQPCQPQTGHPIGQPGTPNIDVVAHVPLPGPRFSHADIKVEQEMSRPFVYIAQRFGTAGFYALSIEDPANPQVLHRWTIENPDLHVGSGGLNPMYAKVNGRYYLSISFQFGGGGPNADLGAIFWDVTGLPDASTIQEVARIRVPEYPGGFHNTFTYKHSDGRALFFATTQSQYMFVWDVEDLVESGGEAAPIAQISVPESAGDRRSREWHDMFVGYHPDSEQDRLYGAGTGGGHVFDVTDTDNIRLITSITNIPGVVDAHTFTPTPDGRYGLLMPEPTYQHSPIRFFDLQPGLDGEQETLSGAGVGAWIAKWGGATHNHEMRWPYAFVSAQDDGLQIINLMDPTNPYTQGYYNTREGPALFGPETRNATQGNIYNGAWGVDVRNADGLIVVSDFNSGFWAFRMQGFQGWNGTAWGMPNVSSAQDWDFGPVEQSQRLPY